MGGYLAQENETRESLCFSGVRERRENVEEEEKKQRKGQEDSIGWLGGDCGRKWGRGWGVVDGWGFPC